MAAAPFFALNAFGESRFEAWTSDDGLPQNSVYSILQTRDGYLWFTTLGGLVRYDGVRFTVFNKSNSAGIISNRFIALYEDAEGSIWIGTEGSGLTRYRNGSFVTYTKRDGLPDAQIKAVGGDAQGRLLVRTNRGVAEWENGQFVQSAQNELTTEQISVLEPMRRQTGFSFFDANGFHVLGGEGIRTYTTQDGVAVVDPRAITSNELPPPVAIEEFILDNQPHVFRTDAQIPVGVESFEIHYTGLSFVRPEQVSFKYKLEGLDKDWVDAGTRRTAYYSHVPPGDYKFMVMAANSDGVWNTSSAFISINVAPPFWRTWWFYALALLCALALGVFIYRRRAARLNKRHAAQQAFSKQLIESQERERKRIAGELHDSLGQNLLVIKNRAQMGLISPDDAERAQKQLHEISHTAAESIEEVREIAYNLHPYQLDSLGLTKAIEAMLKKVEHSSGIRFFAAIDNLDDALPVTSEINLFRVVQESINNVVKHSGATEATVSIRKAFPFIHLNVSDNGKGFAHAASAINAESSKGLGLRGIDERVRILGGTCQIESAPDKGTSINVAIKLSWPGWEDNRYVE